LLLKDKIPPINSNKSIFNILPVFLFDVADDFVGNSVITDETIVVSGCISYVPFDNLVHNVNAIRDLSS